MARVNSFLKILERLSCKILKGEVDLIGKGLQNVLRDQRGGERAFPCLPGHENLFYVS